MIKKLISSLLIVSVVAFNIHYKSITAHAAAVFGPAAAAWASMAAAAGVTFASRDEIVAAYQEWKNASIDNIKFDLELQKATVGTVISMTPTVAQAGFKLIRDFFTPHYDGLNRIDFIPELDFTYYGDYKVVNKNSLFVVNWYQQPTTLDDLFLFRNLTLIQMSYGMGSSVLIEQPAGLIDGWIEYDGDYGEIAKAKIRQYGQDKIIWEMTPGSMWLGNGESSGRFLLLTDGQQIRLCVYGYAWGIHVNGWPWSFYNGTDWDRGVPIVMTDVLPISPSYGATVDIPNVLIDDDVTGFPAMLERIRWILNLPDVATLEDVGFGVKILDDPVNITMEDVIVANPAGSGTHPGTGTGSGATDLTGILALLAAILAAINAGLMSFGDFVKALPGMFTATASPDPGDGKLNFDKFKNINIKGVFPFCIPFDFISMIKTLNASSEAPKFEMTFDATVFGKYTWKLNLSEYDDLASIVRWGIFITFCIGLMLNTRRFIKW